MTILRVPLAAIAAGVLLTGPARAAEEIWVDRLDGPASMNDYGEAVAVADDGSVYVAGFVFEQVGAGSFAPRFMTIKYDPAGTRVWTRTYAGTFATGAAAAQHIAIDPNGDIVVGGATNQSDDWAVVKYNPTGDELWRSVYEANSTFLTNPEAMTLDDAGNIYLVGYVGDNLNPNAGALVKFTPDGTEAWARRYYGPLFEGANFSAVAVDNAGHVYAAGGAIVPETAGDMVVVQYDDDGNEQWYGSGGYPGTFVYDRADAVAVDSQGNVVVAGSFGINSVFGIDVAIAKYDVNGTKLWEQLYAGPDGRTDGITQMAIDGNDDIVLVGYTEVTFDDYAALTLKYDAGGVLQWDRRVSGPDVHFDWAAAVDLDSQNNIYVAGGYDPIGGSRFFTVRYAPDGNEEWFMDYAGPLGGGGRANSVAVGPDHRVYVTGESPGNGAGFDIVTIRYDQAPVTLTGDIDGDGVVDFGDLVTILSNWGACHGCASCPADLNGDCAVTLADLLIVLSNWS